MRHRIVLLQTTVGIRVSTRLGRCSVVALAVAAWACRSEGDSTASVATRAALSRGDHVVVEPRAAQFFEGRVLSIGKSQLRVEPVGKHEGISVAVSDVYPIERPRTALKAGQLAICRVGERWTGCRVEHASESNVEIVSLEGERSRLTPAAILTASPVTELNLKRAFGKVSTASAFVTAAANAGRPVAPAGYRVTPRSRVVARRSAGWFSGVVADVHDDGAHVSFAPEGASEQIALSDIVPEPPSSIAPSRGDFALIRPTSPAEPWQPMRVLGPEQRDFKVAGADGNPRIVLPRDLLPLVTPSGG